MAEEARLHDRIPLERIAALESRCEVLTQLVMKLLVIAAGRGGASGGDASINQQLAAIMQKLQGLATQGAQIVAEIDELEREVGELKTVSESVEALLDGLKAKLDEAIASGNMARVKAVREEMDRTESRLVAAVIRNTPAADEPPPPPTP